jgi:hypothetical protein
MCIWQKYENGAPKIGESLLLLGIEGSGNYDNGYWELKLGSDGKPLTPVTLAKPGTDTDTNDTSSVKPDKKSSYEASLARYHVYHILQLPPNVDPPDPAKENWQPFIFASTTQNGVWVLDRSGGWNAQK